MVARIYQQERLVSHKENVSRLSQLGLQPRAVFESRLAARNRSNDAVRVDATDAAAVEIEVVEVSDVVHCNRNRTAQHRKETISVAECRAAAVEALEQSRFRLAAHSEKDRNLTRRHIDLANRVVVEIAYIERRAGLEDAGGRAELDSYARTVHKTRE